MRNLIIFLFFAAGALWAGSSEKEYSENDFRRISATAARVLDRNHYSDVRMSRELSERIFDEFMDTLDPARLLFTQKDVQKFAAERPLIGSELQDGRYSLAFRVYALYRRRYAEFRAFTQEMLKKGIDLTVEEEYLADRSEEPRPADEEAQRELWRLRIKEDYLFFRLMERSDSEARRKTPEADSKKRISVSPEERILRRQRDTGNVIEKRSEIEILGILLDAMARSYGAHSNYQSPLESDDFDIHMSLSLSGIGATLSTENGFIKIVEIVPGSPAERCGKLEVNDYLISATQEDGSSVDLVDMPVSRAVNYIRGREGTKVVLEVRRGEGSSAHLETVTLTREKISLESAAAKGDIRKIPGKNGSKEVRVGVLTIPSFYADFEGMQKGLGDARRVSSDVKKILRDFQKEKVDSIVVDLRRNGGGSFSDALMISGFFLPGGPIVSVRTKEGIEMNSDEDPSLLYDGPLVLLTSKLSASASEIFAAALRDNKRAVVVGDSRTFGKGTVLRVESFDRYIRFFGSNLPSGTLTLEVAMFYRPNGSSVQQLGLASDIRLPSFTEELKVGEIYMHHHLPWDSVATAHPKPYAKNPEKWIPELRKNSETRIAADPEYRKLISQIEVYRSAIKERKKLSLNEKRRWEEYCREKQAAEAAEEMLTEPGAMEEDSKVADRKKKGKGADPILNESVQIAADLFRLMQKDAKR